MAVKHTTPADGTFSAEGAIEWDRDHTVEAGTITPTELDRVYTVPADLAPFQYTSSLSSAAFRASSFFAASTVISTASFRDSSFFAQSTVISSAAFRSQGFFAFSTHASTHITGGSDLIPVYTETSTGIVPLSLGSTGQFLRGDGLWSTPTGGGSASTHASTHITGGSDIIPVYTETSTGLAPLSLGSTGRFLRGDGLWFPLSSAAFRDSSFFAASSVISSAAFTASSDYALSSHSLLTQTGYSGGATTFLSGISTFVRPTITALLGYSGGSTAYLSGLSTFNIPNVTTLTGFTGGATTFLSGGSTFVRPSVIQLDGYSGGSTAFLSGQSSFHVPNITTLSGYTGNTAHFLRADSTFAAPSGGSDPWTFLLVSSAHYGTSNLTFSNVPGLSFVPGTNSTYLVEGMLMMKTSTAAVVPRIRIRWPTGTSSAAWLNLGQAQSTAQFWFGNEISTLNNSSTGVFGTTTGAWPYFFGATIRALGGAASSFGVQFSTGSSIVFVSTMIGSYIRYRTVV